LGFITRPTMSNEDKVMMGMLVMEDWD
jgi:hypothetical protein